LKSRGPSNLPPSRGSPGLARVTPCTSNRKAASFLGPQSLS
jgi:hypothetical protein